MTNKAKPEKEVTTTVVFHAPRNLVRHFKAHCVLRGTTMKDQFEQFMREKIKETKI